MGWLEGFGRAQREIEGFVMGLSANEFRKLARNCIQEAERSIDDDGKQMLLDIARLYNQTALHIEAGQSRSVTQRHMATAAVQ